VVDLLPAVIRLVLITGRRAFHQWPGPMTASGGKRFVRL